MKYLSGSIDPFLSPVTGLLATPQPQPDQERGYIWMGDKNNRPIPSFKLIDLTIDVHSLQQQVKNSSTLEHQKIWLGDAYNRPQAVSTIETTNLPPLGVAGLPYPASSHLPPVPIPNPDWNPLVPLSWIMSGPLLGQIFIGSSSAPYTEWETSISSSYALTQTKIAQILKRFDVGGFVIKNKTINYNWSNPAMALIPDTLKTLYKLEDSYTFENAQALDAIGEGLLYNKAGDLRKAVAGTDYLDLVHEPPIGVIPVVLRDKVITRSPLIIVGPIPPFDIVWRMPDLLSTKGQVLKIDIDLAGARVLKFDNILPDNLQDGLLSQGKDEENNPVFVNASLKKGMTWQGDANNVPQEVDLNLRVQRPLTGKGEYATVIQHSLPVFLDTEGEKLTSTEVTIENNRLYAEGLLANNPAKDIVRGFETPYILNPLDPSQLPEIRWRLPKTPGLFQQLLCIEGVESGMIQLGWRYERVDERPVKNYPDGKYVRDPTGDWIWVVTTAAIAGGVSWLGSPNSTQGEIPVYTADGGDTIKGSPATIDEEGNILTPGDITAETLTVEEITAAGTVTAATLILSGTDAMAIPRGTSSQRPAVPLEGMLRYNTHPD